MAPEEEPKQRKGFFSALAKGLSKTRRNMNEGFERLVGAHAKLDEEFMEELEEILFAADIGPEITMRIVGDLRRDVKKNLLKDTGEVVEFIKKELTDILIKDTPKEQEDVEIPKPFVLLVIGVNGAGKTTTIGKIAAKLVANDKKVLLAAADTFRAAAIEQLETWSRRAGTDFVRQKEGADPAAVVYDAMQAAKNRGVDVVIADTAGRLHSKVNLMEELKKVKRIIEREIPGAPHETLLVLDGTTGQNAVNQAKMFHEAVGITGLVLTKLDGTAKGGVVINITESAKTPVKLIGVGEKAEDLRPFDPQSFVSAIFTGKAPGADLSDSTGE
ncbi:MAG: signal recognition particle-docking protein FtsY [Nitrospinota bacterium]|nr:signal recognition particle-docking protein FtsY [Nitrospinota bacterium]